MRQLPVALGIMVALGASALAADRPNILVICTDYYGEQSCTAGRASFIMGQSVFRTGLSKVGLPGAELGMRVEDPTIAGLLKNHGYMTGQFGKKHLGDDQARSWIARPLQEKIR